MPQDLTGSFCQSCLTWNSGERSTCQKCGHKLLIVTGEDRWDDHLDESSEDLEEHLLERITVLEESLRRAETYLESISEQLGKLERAEIMIRNGLMALVQEMEEHRQLDGRGFSERWEDLVDENLHLIGAREIFGKYRTRIIPLTRAKHLAQTKRALIETNGLLEAGDLPAACKRLQQALALEPKNYELLFLTAALWEATFQYIDAEPLARKVVHLSPRHFEGWMLLSKLYRELPDKVDHAITALHTACDLRPDDAEPRLQLATLLEEQEDLDGALDASREATLRRRDPETLSCLGEIYLSRNEGLRAVDIFKEALGLAPIDPTLKEQLAEAYLMTGERSKTFDIAHELLEQSPQDRSLLLMLDASTHAQLRSARDGSNATLSLLNEAEDLIDENNIVLGEALLKKARKKEVTDRLEWLELKAGFTKEPLKHIKQANEFSKSNHHPRLCYEALQMAMGHFMKEKQTESVLEILKGFLRAHPQTSGAWEAVLQVKTFLMLSDNIIETDLQEVRVLFDHPLPGQKSRARILLGQMLLALNRPEEIPALITPVLHEEPTLLNYFQLGAAYARTGKIKESIAILREGVRLHAGDLSDDQAKQIKQQMEDLLKELSQGKMSKS